MAVVGLSGPYNYNLIHYRADILHREGNEIGTVSPNNKYRRYFQNSNLVTSIKSLTALAHAPAVW